MIICPHKRAVVHGSRPVSGSKRVIPLSGIPCASRNHVIRSRSDAAPTTANHGIVTRCFIMPPPTDRGVGPFGAVRITTSNRSPPTAGSVMPPPTDCGVSVASTVSFTTTYCGITGTGFVHAAASHETKVGGFITESTCYCGISICGSVLRAAADNRTIVATSSVSPAAAHDGEVEAAPILRGVRAARYPVHAPAPSASAGGTMRSSTFADETTPGRPAPGCVPAPTR